MLESLIKRNLFMTKKTKICANKRNFFFFLVFMLSFQLQAQTGLGLKTIVIDPGHGGKDPGAIGKKMKTMEKTVVLNVSLLLGDLIKKNFPEIKVIYTRDTDQFVGLASRAKIANKAGADFFLSIHANAVDGTSASGFESWVLGLHKTKAALEVAKKENSAILMEDDHNQTYQEFNPKDPDAYIALSMRQNAFLDQSLIFADLLQKDCTKKLGIRNRGVKQAGFMVLYRATMPAVLVELGFLSNVNEEKLLASKEGQLKLANHLFESFKEYKLHYDAVDESIIKGVSENNVKQENELVQTEEIDQSGVLFKVQISTSSSKIETTPSNFKGLNGVDVYLSGKFYKYTYGNCKNFKEAKGILKELNELGYSTAFITAFENGKRINLQEAINKTE
jgi:N-acetylmuramoyl-L-alanine amidase